MFAASVDKKIPLVDLKNMLNRKSDTCLEYAA